jgi:hypothetical protein
MTQMTVTKAHKTTWGSYTDRKDSYDDDADITAFIQLCKKDSNLHQYLSTYLPKKSLRFKPKMNGIYGVDLSIITEDGKVCATIDIERWSQWNEDWPSYYRYIHFLGRKEKFLNQYNVPFFMAFMNYSRTKVLMISEQDIRKYPTIDKYFKHKRVTDRVKELPMSDGYVYGKGITNREKELFHCHQ